MRELLLIVCIEGKEFDDFYISSESKSILKIAKSKGFLLVSSTPLTRSSYHADEDFVQLQKNRLEN